MAGKKEAKKEYLKLEKGRKTKLSRERAKRREKIRKMLEEKMIEADRRRVEKREREEHGAMKVEEVETIEGKEPIGTREKPVLASDFSPEEFRPLSAPFDSSEFYIGIPPEDLELIEKSLREREKAGKKVSDRLRELVREDSAGELHDTRLNTLEEIIRELMERYEIIEREVEGEIQKLDKRSLLHYFERFMSPIELERKAKKELIYLPEEHEKGTPHFKRERERIKKLAREIRIHRIVLDASRAYGFIRKNRKAALREVARALDIPKKKVKEYAEILEKNKLIEIKKPHVGGPVFVLKKRKVGKKANLRQKK